MSDGRACGHEKDNGERCKADFGLCSRCGHCFNHCDHRADERARARKRGGRATAEKLGGALDPDDLPALTTYEGALEWVELTGRRLWEGRVSNGKAKALLKVVTTWKELHESGQLADEVAELREQLAELKRDELRVS